MSKNPLSKASPKTVGELEKRIKEIAEQIRTLYRLYPLRHEYNMADSAEHVEQLKYVFDKMWNDFPPLPSYTEEHKRLWNFSIEVEKWKKKWSGR